MRQIPTLFFSLLISVFGEGQSVSDKIDSLNGVIKTYPANDTNRIKAFYNLSYAIMNKKPDAAMRAVDDGLEIALKLKWDRGIALGYRQKSVVYYFLNYYTQSLEYAQKALRAGEALKDELFDATVYSNMANIYADFGQYDKALEYYKKLLASAREAKNKNFTLIALTNIGSVYIDKKEFKTGARFFEQALEIAHEEKEVSDIVSILNNLGKVNEHLENYPGALDYYRRAIALSDTAQNINSKAVAFSNMGIVYYKLNNYEDAVKYSNQALELAKETGSVTCQGEAWANLSDIYEKLHQDKASLNAYKKYILLRDSIVGDEKKQEITKKEMQFEFEKKEAVLTAIHQAEVRQQQTIRNVAIGGAGILIIGGLFSFVFYKRKRDAVQKQLEAEFRTEVADTEMKALRAQMNPHFIFNSLNSIGDYIARNDMQSADRYLGKFAKLMRMILENAEQREVPLAEDLKALELYMQLEALRMNNKFTYEIQVDQSLDKETTMVPPLILQPFVENSIWHGIAKKQGAGKIMISIKKEGGDMINCIVEDDGIGRQLSTSIKTTLPGLERNSLGMKITKSRIDILNKLKNTKGAVELSDLAQGVRVEVKLPFAVNF